MKKLETEWHTDGFVNDAKYSFHISSVVQPYKDKFALAEKLIVNIHEQTYFELSAAIERKYIIISEDKKQLPLIIMYTNIMITMVK
jgi:hypothetical protein